jgi:hypothetical protein
VFFDGGLAIATLQARRFSGDWQIAQILRSIFGYYSQ